MDDERKEIIKQNFNKMQGAIKSGFAGVLPGSGMLVDRREQREAVPVQENEMFGAPKPQSLPELKSKSEAP